MTNSHWAEEFRLLGISKPGPLLLLSAIKIGPVFTTSSSRCDGLVSFRTTVYRQRLCCNFPLLLLLFLFLLFPLAPLYLFSSLFLVFFLAGVGLLCAQVTLVWIEGASRRSEVNQISIWMILHSALKFECTAEMASERKKESQLCWAQEV